MRAIIIVLTKKIDQRAIVRMILVKYTLKEDQSISSIQMQANPPLMIPPNINKHTVAYIEEHLFSENEIGPNLCLEEQIQCSICNNY